MNKKELAKCLEFRALEPIGKERVAEIIGTANKLSLASVSFNPKYAEFAKECITDEDSKVKLNIVVGYPLGENTQEIKTMEAVMAAQAGADEISVVTSHSAVIANNMEYVEEELKRIVDCVEVPVCAIMDNNLLNEEQMIRLCEACVNSGITTVQIGTGYNQSTITQELVKSIADVVAGVCELKVALDIQTVDELYDMACAGATMISTKEVEKILK